MSDNERWAQKLRSVLRHVHAVLDRHEIWHCLMFGTLLGAVRDGDIIDWDHDLDLLIRPADVSRVLALNDEMTDEGLSFWAGRTPAIDLAINADRVPWYDSAYLSIMVDGDSCGELWALSLFSDGVLRAHDFETEVVCWPQSSFAAYFVEQLRAVDIGGVAYPVPAEAEELLGWLYGEDWRIPYRSVRDGGDHREGHSSHGDLAGPRLAAQIEWCESRGWDRSRYAREPAWPRPIRGAGPVDASARAANTSRSPWWHSLEEIAAHY